MDRSRPITSSQLVPIELPTYGRSLTKYEYIKSTESDSRTRRTKSQHVCVEAFLHSLGQKSELSLPWIAQPENLLSICLHCCLVNSPINMKIDLKPTGEVLRSYFFRQRHWTMTWATVRFPVKPSASKGFVLGEQLA